MRQRLLNSIFIAVIASACGGDKAVVVPPPVVVPVASIALDASALTLAPAATQQLTAVVRDAAGTVLTGRMVTWSSNAVGVASVSGTGLVSAVAPGSATITATSEGKSAVASVIVQDPTPVTPPPPAGPVTVTSADGRATLVIPAGAAPSGVTISIVPAAGAPTSPRAAPNARYEISPAGTILSQPAALTIAYDPTTLPATTSQEALRLHAVSQGQWVRVDGSSVDSTARLIRGTITASGTYGVVGRSMLFYEYAARGRGPERESVSVCRGGSIALEPRQMGAASGAANPSMSISDSSTVLAGLNFGALYIDGRAPGSSVVAVQTFGESHLLPVTVITDPVRCRHVALGLIQKVRDSNDVYVLENGTFSRVTATGAAQFVALGRYGGRTGPIAYLSPSSPGILHIHWNGSNGASSPAIIAPPNSRFWEGVFVDNDSYALPVEVNNLSTIYGVRRGAPALVRLTTFPFWANYGLGAGGLGTVVASGSNSDVQPNGSHVFRVPPMSFDGPVAAGPFTPITTSYRETEYDPDISSDDRLVALSHGSLDHDIDRIMIRNLSDAVGAPLTPVSPATGEAHSPSWCGSNIYYRHRAGDHLPFIWYKWNLITKTSAPFVPFAGLSVFEVSSARTSLDGMFVCP